MDEPERVMKSTDEMNELSYPMALASIKTLLQDTENMDAFMQAFEDCHSEDPDNVHEAIEMEDEELGLDRERAEPTE